MVRSLGLAIVAGMLLLSMLCLGLMAHRADADTLRNERQQQEMVLGFAARTLNARIETYQRVLQSMGQGIHSSMLDTPYLLELLLREDAGYAGIFDTLVMTGSDGSMVTYAPSGGAPAGGSTLRDVLRRTLSDGKPQVTQMPREEAPAQLGLLVTVPLRQADGAVRGALAGVVRLPLTGLLPLPGDGQQGLQYMLLDEEGGMLAHSDPQHPLGRMDQELGEYAAQWPGLSSISTSNADSQHWGALLVTRVGMPLPRWQMVALRDVAPQLWSMQRLQPQQWGGLLLAMLLLSLALWWSLWRLGKALYRPARRALQAVAAPQPLPPSRPDAWLAESATSAAPADPWQALEQQLHASQQQAQGLRSSLVQLLETWPQGAIWAQGEVLQHASHRAAHLLGRDAKSLVGLHVGQLLQGQPAARAWVQASAAGMAGFGHYRGELLWQLPDGASRCLQIEGMRLRPPAEGSLWLLEDAGPQRQRSSLPQWLAAHDPSTGLANRQQLEQQMHTTPAPTSHADAGQALLWLDVDYFRVLNATAGRAAGDEVLRQVAWLLHREQGVQGVAARVGGDEFVLWLAQARDASAVQTLAWRLCEVVRSWTPEFGGQRYALGLSIGWLWTAPGGAAPQQLLTAAEQACRAAQREGLSRAVQALLPDSQPR